MGEVLNELVEKCLAGEPDAPQDVGAWSDTERAFTALFALSDPLAVRPDFASRVVRAARHAPLAPGRRALVSRWMRGAQLAAATAALLVGSSAAVTVLGPLVAGVFPSFVPMAVESGLWAFQFLKSVIELWAWSAEVSRALAVVSGTGAGAVTLALTASIGVAAVIGFERLVRSEQESSPC